MFFDPTDIDSIAGAIRMLLNASAHREDLAGLALDAPPFSPGKNQPAGCLPVSMS